MPPCRKVLTAVQRLGLMQSSAVAGAKTKALATSTCNGVTGPPGQRLSTFYWQNPINAWQKRAVNAGRRRQDDARLSGSLLMHAC